jgi:hypothetical protein
MVHLAPVRGAADVACPTLVPDAYDDVALIRWPEEDALLATRRGAGQATLLVLSADQRPPAVWGPLEDWVREPVDAVDVYARRERLRRRLDALAAPVFDEDGLLHRGRRWVSLPELEHRLVYVLLDRLGLPVSRQALVSAIYPDTQEDRHRALDAFVRRARGRLAPLGLEIHTVRGIGYMLEAREMPTDD